MMSQGIDTLEGISAKRTVAADHNGFTMEQALHVSEIIGYSTLYFEQTLGGLRENKKR